VEPQLQEGIHHLENTPPFFAFLLLRARRGATAESVYELLADLWRMYAQLKEGIVRDLPGATDLFPRRFCALLGLGPRAFQLDGARSGPQALKDYSFASPQENGDTSIVAGGAVPFASGVTTNPADVAVAIQFTGETPLSVERPVVETAKVLLSQRDPPLEIATVYTGAQREDRRSWIDFHDGISNLNKADRETVIQIAPKELPAGEDTWTHGGTYLGFIRVAIDLAVWQGLDREQQNQLVGRDKITGCPLVTASPSHGPAGCPVEGKLMWAADNAFREARATTDLTVRDSHIQRANHRYDKPELPSSLRVFRQGYPFLETCAGASGFRIGLNFVSFQGTPSRLIGLLTGHNWLGGVNFGGPRRPGPPLVTAHAAGMFFVPPVRQREAFPSPSILLLSAQ
jgi:hypothetical protein